MNDKPAADTRAAFEGEIGILARRRIEAGIIAPIYEEMCARIGEELAQTILDAAITKAGEAASSAGTADAARITAESARNAAAGYRDKAISTIAGTASAIPSQFMRPGFSLKASTPTSVPSTTTPMFIAANTSDGFSGNARCACT